MKTTRDPQAIAAALRELADRFDQVDADQLVADVVVELDLHVYDPGADPAARRRTVDALAAAVGSAGTFDRFPHEGGRGTAYGMSRGVDADGRSRLLHVGPVEVDAWTADARTARAARAAATRAATRAAKEA